MVTVRTVVAWAIGVSVGMLSTVDAKGSGTQQAKKGTGKTEARFSASSIAKPSVHQQPVHSPTVSPRLTAHHATGGPTKTGRQATKSGMASAVHSPIGTFHAHASSITTSTVGGSKTAHASKSVNVPSAKVSAHTKTKAAAAPRHKK